MNSHAVAWIIFFLFIGIAFLGGAARGIGGVGSRAAAWIVLFTGIAFIGGILGGLLSSVL